MAEQRRLKMNTLAVVQLLFLCTVLPASWAFSVADLVKYIPVEVLQAGNVTVTPGSNDGKSKIIIIIK